MKVLVIAEDPTYDQYILKPIGERIFRDLDRPVRVEVLRDRSRHRDRPVMWDLDS